LHADLCWWSGEFEFCFGGNAVVPGHCTNRLGQDFKRSIRIVASHGNDAVGADEVVRATDDLSSSVFDGDVEGGEFHSGNKVHVPHLNLSPR
jgi:hypothetical protein